MLLRACAPRSPLCVWFLAVAAGCGARDSGSETDVNPPPLSTIGAVFGPDGGLLEETCAGPLDCEFTDLCFPRACIGGRCEELTPIECNDGDECTTDFCDPNTGACSFTDRTFDEDQDGFKGPLPGFQPGSEGACGADCDDSSARAFPGGREACDGVDNDCNGVVDDQFEFLPPTEDAVLVSSGAKEGTPGGVAHNGDFFGLSFTSRIDRSSNQLLGLIPPSRVVLPAVEIPKVNSDTYAGPLIWNGNVFATAWEDRRDDNFEIYFNRLDSQGNKLGPDLRLSTAIDFSLDPDVLYTGQEYIVVWADRRNGRNDYRIYGQRISRDGQLLSVDNVDLSSGFPGGESPSLALGSKDLGMAYGVEREGRRVVFRSIGLDLAPGEPQILSREGGVFPTVTANNGEFVVAWHESRANFPGDAIWASVVSPTGNVVVEARPVTEPAAFARSHRLLAMGDRLLLVWSQHQNGSYDLFSRLLSRDLTPLTEAQQVTFSEGDARNPRLAFGAQGEVGILYLDHVGGTQQAFFTSMSCR